MRPWWRPIAFSAAAAAAIAALFQPIPALADPGSAQGSVSGSVPDTGSQPTAVGTLTMPGQSTTTTATTASTPTAASTTLPGTATSPVLQKVQQGRDAIATMGDQLIQLNQQRQGAQTQLTTAQTNYGTAETSLRAAQTNAATAAAQDILDAAALPPGVSDSGLLGLDDLSRLQRGQGDSSSSAARELDSAQVAAQLALDAESLAEQRYDGLDSQYKALDAKINTKQASQKKYEQAHATEINAAEASETAVDSQLGASYLAGSSAGRSADPRAVQALEFALAQRGKPYVWSTEGPNTYDCSGLVWAAYRSVGVTLNRVSRDQYYQTHAKVVDRYSLLPGDLLFFSYSNSWRGIHHVAMYAGNGMMVEAPRTGLNVRLVPVRWSELFQATRVLGSVEGDTPGPTLGSPDPEPAETTPTKTATPTKSASPTASATTKPSSGSPSPSGSSSATPTKSTTPTPTPTPSQTSSPTPTPTPTTNPPTSSSPTTGTSSPSSGGSSGSGSSSSSSSSNSSPTSGSTSSASADESKSASATKSSASSSASESKS